MSSNNEILSLLKDFHNVSGLRISIYSPDLKEKFAYPQTALPFCSLIWQNKKAKDRCVFGNFNALEMAKRTKKPYVYECHCGLWEAAAPIYHFDKLVGFLTVGQVAQKKPNVYDNIRKNCKLYFSDDAALQKAIENISVVEREKCESSLSLMIVLAQYIAKKSLIVPEKQDLAARVMSYIAEHYSEDLSLVSLCEKMNCSKSTLMKAFRDRYQKSVGDAIHAVRLQNAQKYLLDKDASVKSVAIACGFFDQNYFAKVFKAEFGMSPTRWRELNS